MLGCGSSRLVVQLVGVDRGCATGNLPYTYVVVVVAIGCCSYTCCGCGTQPISVIPGVSYRAIRRDVAVVVVGKGGTVDAGCSMGVGVACLGIGISSLVGFVGDVTNRTIRIGLPKGCGGGSGGCGRGAAIEFTESMVAVPVSS